MKSETFRRSLFYLTFFLESKSIYCPYLTSIEGNPTMESDINLQQPHFKPVYIMGAGASKSIGAPLVNDFLPKARSLIYDPIFSQSLEQDFMRDKLRKQFECVFEYQKELYKTRHFMGIDFDNLETLFSILDMDWQIASIPTKDEPDTPETEDAKRLKEIRQALFSLIIGTLKLSINKTGSQYDFLIRALAANPGSSFITFNYDNAIEDALKNKAVHTIDYGFDKTNETSTITRTVLELHGSANWTYCDQCKKITTGLNYITPIEFESNRQLLHDLYCRNTSAFNVIIPPTWYKFNYLDIFTKIWQRAIQEISLATHLFIIGYSFPRTDVFFEQLMTLGLRESKNLKNIIVVNPDPSLEERLQKVFDSHFFTRCVIFKQTHFEKLFAVNPTPINEEKNIISFISSIK